MVRRRPETSGPGVQPGSVGAIVSAESTAAVRPRLLDSRRRPGRTPRGPSGDTRRTRTPVRGQRRDHLRGMRFMRLSSDLPGGTSRHGCASPSSAPRPRHCLVARWVRPCCSPRLFPVSVPVTALDSPRGRRRIEVVTTTQCAHEAEASFAYPLAALTRGECLAVSRKRYGLRRLSIASERREARRRADLPAVRGHGAVTSRRGRAGPRTGPAGPTTSSRRDRGERGGRKRENVQQDKASPHSRRKSLSHRAKS